MASGTIKHPYSIDNHPRLMSLGVLNGSYKFTFNGTIRFFFACFGISGNRTGLYQIVGYAPANGSTFVEVINEANSISFDTSTTGVLKMTVSANLAGYIVALTTPDFSFAEITTT